MFKISNAVLVGLFLLGGLSANGQSNVFPSSGNVGIGRSTLWPDCMSVEMSVLNQDESRDWMKKFW